jgi:hypothetical protein
MATLTRQRITEEGAVVTFGAAAGGGDVVDNSDGKTFLLVTNGAGSSMTVTVAEQISGTTVDDPNYGTLSKADAAVTVTAGATAAIGPFKKTAFNNGSNQIAITYSSATSVTIAAMYL